MHTQQYILLGIMVVGGAAVIGSYIHGFVTHPGSANVLWGGVLPNVSPFVAAVPSGCKICREEGT